MKLSPQEVELVFGVEDDPIEEAGKPVILWVSQQEYGENQTALVSSYTVTPFSRKLILICECTVQADGTVYYDRSRFDGRDISKLLFQRVMPAISEMKAAEEAA